MPKKARLSGIKAFRTYTINEAAEVSGVSPRTISNWVKGGLSVLDDERPVLIRGDDLRDYIKSQRSERSRKTRLDTFYCVRCKAQRAAAAAMADCDLKHGRARLTALCESCGTVVSKPVAEAKITELGRTLDLRIERHV
ncbi:helix-turn-helix domain-containing protein [Flavimaricola marinus]|uniref:Helix-turn-helix domain protein n=1 Tax=Flavimaricola marinus TaxID=1819565 RepID=A0A238LKP4_9RHOB|nr:helix-turn-helix domain-containing protein [Flavimaricola marinus]SMY09955.1 Helix-turn-helix domain protein [Flavimaricola marinus]